MRRIIQVARDEKVRRLQANVLRENDGMRRLLEKLDFKLEDGPDPATVTASLTLA